MLAIQNYQQNFQNMMNPNMNIINQTNFPPLNMPQFGNNNNFNVNKKNA